MEEEKKLLIMRILGILGAILPLLNGFMFFLTGGIISIIGGILYIAVAIVLIIMCIKPNKPIPFKGLLLLILGIVIIVLGFAFSTDMGMVGIVISGIIVAIAGILDYVIK